MDGDQPEDRHVHIRTGLHRACTAHATGLARFLTITARTARPRPVRSPQGKPGARSWATVEAMTSKLPIVLLAAAAAAAGCKKKNQPPTGGSTTGSGSAEGSAAGSAAGSGSAEGSGSAAGSADSAAAGSGSAAADEITVSQDLSTPESILYDEADDLYLVSNINGAPTDADGNGYISKVSPDGKVLDAKWIDGTKPGVKLDAPKGSALADGVLWVADITNVRQFDAKTGAPKGSIKIPGSTFLNDVTPDGHGGVFVSDTGVDGKFAPTGADAIYHVTKDGKVTPLIKNKDLGGPNGVLAGPDGSVWVVTMRTGELYQVTAKGEKQKAEKLPKGQLDGIVGLDNGELLISSWEGKEVFRGKPGGPWTAVISDVTSPADIGWDPKRHRVLIPVFLGNQLQFRTLE
jgi:sugar lactone lactonase YvrE